MLPLSTRPHTLMERLLAHTQGMLPVLRTAVEQTIDSHNRQQALRRNYMRQNGISMAQWQKLLAPMKANALSVFWRTVRARVNALLRAVV
jgi:predicted NAD/FAD-binding protein